MTFLRGRSASCLFEPVLLEEPPPCCCHPWEGSTLSDMDQVLKVILRLSDHVTLGWRGCCGPPPVLLSIKSKGVSSLLLSWKQRSVQHLDQLLPDW